MGNVESKSPIYSVPLQATETEDCSTIYRAANSPHELVSTFADKDVRNCWELFQLGVKEAPDERCLGSRATLPDGTLANHFHWLTYKEVEMMAVYLGSGLQHLDCVPELDFDESYQSKYRFCGIFAKNRSEWIICEQACNAYGIVIVPLYDTLGSEALTHILEQTGLRVVVCSSECTAKLLELFLPFSHVGRAVRVQTIVCMDELTDSLREQARKSGVILLQWEDVVQEGKTHPTPLEPPNPYHANTICYTSAAVRHDWDAEGCHYFTKKPRVGGGSAAGSALGVRHRYISQGCASFTPTLGSCIRTYYRQRYARVRSAYRIF